MCASKWRKGSRQSVHVARSTIIERTRVGTRQRSVSGIHEQPKPAAESNDHHRPAYPVRRRTLRELRSEITAADRADRHAERDRPAYETAERERHRGDEVHTRAAPILE